MTHSNYTADDNRYGMTRSVYDAIRRGHKGAVAIVDENGEVDVTPIGGAEVSVREATETDWLKSYNQMGGAEWERAKAESHKVGEKTKGRFEPQISASAGDAALAAEKKAADAKRAKLTADARAFNRSQFERNEKFAADAKAAAARMWPKNSPVGFSRGR